MSESFFVTAAAGTADLCAVELRECGIPVQREGRAGVYCDGGVEAAYRACLWSRVGLRVLWPIAQFKADSADDLYRGALTVDWARHLDVSRSLAVEATGQGEALAHSHYAALRVKDAVVDWFRERDGRRPDIDTRSPDLRLSIHVQRGEATLAIDFAGDGLHRRGYRLQGVAAPLRENLAAAVLQRSGWPAIARAGGAFVDPMCGSGTLPIEAALMAGDVAPGLLRPRHGFERWAGHQPATWERLLDEAQSRRAAAHLAPGRVFGFDADPRAIEVAEANAQRAGVSAVVQFRRLDLARLPAAPGPAGLLATNPPYGERIGDEQRLRGLYATLGERLREAYPGWRAAVLTGNPPLGQAIGIEATRSHLMMNGPIECRLLRFEVDPGRFRRPREPGRPPPFDVEAARARPGAAMFANRLRKNLKEIGGWARRERVSCFRLYDADMPEYALAIDVYQADPEGVEGRWLYVQEYAAPSSVDRDRARARREEALCMLPEVTGIAPAATWWRTRRPQKGAAQYRKLDEQGRFETIEEGGLHFAVNFTDYLDTGLFLDYRQVRARVRELAAGKRFLNLFAYTGTATVYAAAGGAIRTETVDLSNTYLDWARRNLELNGLARPVHTFTRADCLEWLNHDDGRRFDLVLLDPPTFSNSKAMAREFDVQRDHVGLIRLALERVAEGGLLIFSTNLQKFRLDREALQGPAVEDWSRSTLPRDFARRPGIRSVFAFRK